MSNLGSRALALVVALLPLGCGDPVEDVFSDEDRLLEHLMDEYVAARFGFYPVESTLAGLPGRDAMLGSFSPGDIASRVAWLSDFHTKLAGLDVRVLSQPAYLDALWLTSLTKAELFDLEERRLWAVSPRFYAEQALAGLVPLLLDPDLANRTEDLGKRLDAVSPLVEQASENLNGVPPLSRRDGVSALLLCRDLLSDMPLLLEERVPSYRVAELSEKGRLALRSLQALIDRLSQAASADSPPFVLGEEGLSAYFLHQELVDWSPDRIRLEARKAIEDASNQMIEVALERLPSRDLDALLAGSAPSGALEEDVALFETRARSFLGAGASDEVPERPIPVRRAPPYFLARERVRLWRPASLDPVREVSLLVSAGEPIDSRSLELATLTEIAGSYRLFVRQSESASLLRRVFRSRAASEGWKSRLVRSALDLGYASDDPELRLRKLHRDLIDALRLEAAVTFHAFGARLEDVERRFREAGRLPREAAVLEAQAVAVDPGAGSAALGRLLLEDLARDYLRAHPLISPEELEKTLLAEGLVPVRLLRFKLLGLEPSRVRLASP